MQCISTCRFSSRGFLSTITLPTLTNFVSSPVAAVLVVLLLIIFSDFDSTATQLHLLGPDLENAAQEWIVPLLRRCCRKIIL